MTVFLIFLGMSALMYAQTHFLFKQISDLRDRIREQSEEITTIHMTFHRIKSYLERAENLTESLVHLIKDIMKKDAIQASVKEANAKLDEPRIAVRRGRPKKNG